MGKQKNKPSIAQELHDATKQLGDAIKNTFTNPIEFGTGSNKSKIDKLKALDKGNEFGTCKEKDLRKYLSYAVSSDIAKEIFIHFDKIIKLNEDLTAENAKVLKSCDELNMGYVSIKHQLDVTSARLSWEIECRLTDEKISLNRLRELQTIKSKWWYKLMMWEW